MELALFIFYFIFLKKGLLYDVFASRKSYPNIDTLDDLYKSKLEIHVRHAGLVTDIFGHEDDETTLGKLRKRLIVSSDDFLNQRIVTSGNIAALERYANYEFENNKLVPRADGISNLHLVAECPRCPSLFELLFLFSFLLLKKKSLISSFYFSFVLPSSLFLYLLFHPYNSTGATHFHISYRKGQFT